jgi:hypothetical protein
VEQSWITTVSPRAFVNLLLSSPNMLPSISGNYKNVIISFLSFSLSFSFFFFFNSDPCILQSRQSLSKGIHWNLSHETMWKSCK